MLVTITQASKLVGKARKTIYHHANTGKVSLSKFTDGRTAIDTSELHRFYGEFKKGVTLTQDKKAGNVTDGNVAMELLNELKKENVLMRGEMEKLRAEIKNLNNRLEYKPVDNNLTASAPVVEKAEQSKVEYSSLIDKMKANLANKNKKT